MSTGRDGHRALGVPLFPKCPFAPSAHLPQCPFVNIWGKWTPGTWGTLFPQMSICLGAYLHQCPFPPVPNSTKYIFSPNTHFPTYPYAQIFIFPSANLLQAPIIWFRLHLLGTHLSWCPIVRDPFVLESSNLHLFALLSYIQKQKVFGYRQVAQLKLLRHCLASKFH